MADKNILKVDYQIDKDIVKDMLENYDKVSASAHGPRSVTGKSVSGSYSFKNGPKAEAHAYATTGRAEGATFFII